MKPYTCTLAHTADARCPLYTSKWLPATHAAVKVKPKERACIKFQWLQIRLLVVVLLLLQELPQHAVGYEALPPARTPLSPDAVHTNAVVGGNCDAAAGAASARSGL
jgi:hypothetical protein